MAPLHTCISDALGNVDAHFDLHEGRGVGARPHHLQEGEEGVPVGGRVDVGCVSLEQLVESERHLATHAVDDQWLHHEEDA